MHVPETAAAQRSPVNRAPRRRGEENKARYPPAYIRGTLSRAADVAEDAAGVVQPPPVHLPVLLRATLAAPAATPSALLQPRCRAAPVVLRPAGGLPVQEERITRSSTFLSRNFSFFGKGRWRIQLFVDDESWTGLRES